MAPADARLGWSWTRSGWRLSEGSRRARLVHHSDQGSPYTSLAFGERCCEAGIARSMGSVGDAYDNAMCESESELIDRRRFATMSEAQREVFRFIEGFYNTCRLYSALGLHFARELRETRPCGLNRICGAGATRSSPGSRARSPLQSCSLPLSTVGRAKALTASHTINPNNQSSVKAGQVQNERGIQCGRLVKHFINLLFYPFFLGYTVRQLFPGGKGRSAAEQMLDSLFTNFERNVLRLDDCNRTGSIDEDEMHMIVDSHNFYADMRFTDESLVNPIVMFLLFPVRSFRFWQMKRRMKSALRTGPIAALMTEIREQSVHLDPKQRDSHNG